MKSGFTIIELMVAVAIVGVLATIAIPTYRSYEANAKKAEATTSLSSAFLAEKSFYTDQK